MRDIQARPMIALTLSGGGARAIAFHLGCLRALQERKILDKVGVISAVSGGSVIAAMFAYSNVSFAEFCVRVETLLHNGLQWSIVRKVFAPRILLKVLTTNIVSVPAALFARILGQQPPFRRWTSRTDALEAVLNDVLGGVYVSEVARPNLDIVLGATELRTRTAFRFGNRRSGGLRFGEIRGNQISVAHAVASSAAYPLLLPSYDRSYTFVKDGRTLNQRVIIADGGLYDNLGLSCVEPGRDDSLALHSYAADYIACCHAGHGQFSGKSIPFGFISRMSAGFESVFRKSQDAALNRLHMYRKSGAIKGFVLPYLGQQDDRLPHLPSDLVRREQVVDYPTDFRPMSIENIRLISKRGEQLTRLLISAYCPGL